MKNFIIASLLIISLSSINSIDVSCDDFPVENCLPGDWPNSDSEIGGSTFPGRHTHYGSTSGGACGFNFVVNCMEGQDGNCDTVPQDLLKAPHAGFYAAPQGNYFAQQSSGNFSYLSCGECWEIQCYDDKCTTDNKVTIQLADACPCQENPKWCCGAVSECTELGPDKDGHPHCAISPNGIWDEDRSIHLDLNDLAFGYASTGSAKIMSGIFNSNIRRVSCEPVGNMYLHFAQPPVYSANCTAVWPASYPCFYFLAINAYNVKGYGAIEKLWLNAGIIEDGEFIVKDIDLEQCTNCSVDLPQETYNMWNNPQNQAIFFPVQFKFMDRGGRILESQVFDSFSGDIPEFLDMGVQFEAIPNDSEYFKIDKFDKY